jgi:hypothetical protein
MNRLGTITVEHDLTGYPQFLLRSRMQDVELLHTEAERRISTILKW